jgi:hypothetical protein
MEVIVSHRIIITENGTGPGGTSEVQVTYTPSHDVPRGEQIRRIEKAGRMIAEVNDMLYSPPGAAVPDA